MNYNLEQQNSLFSSITAKKSTISLNNQNLEYRFLIYFINYNSVLNPGKKQKIPQTIHLWPIS